MEWLNIFQRVGYDREQRVVQFHNISKLGQMIFLQVLRLRLRSYWQY